MGVRENQVLKTGAVVLGSGFVLVSIWLFVGHVYTTGVSLMPSLQVFHTPENPAVIVDEMDVNDAELEVAAVTQDEQLAVIEQWYAPLYPMTIGSTTLLASIADTPETRTRGLSGTPYLPAGLAKLFIFPESNAWGFWMKDMNYAIDIIWINSELRVVHIAAAVSPASFPKSFTPPVPALYVVEVPSGYAAAQGIAVGDVVTLPLRE